MIHHFYHIYADGNWRAALEEHQRALSSLMEHNDVEVTVGIVGSQPNRQVVQNYLSRDWWKAEFDDGWEQQTLDLIFAHGGIEADDLVLYAHSKGAANPSDVNTVWRRCMTQKLIIDWRTPLAELAAGHDTVGVHWLTPEEHPDTVQVPYYGGNFWWASAAHIRRLSAPTYETRYHAEAWLGSVRPDRPKDLQPGWPGAGCKDH